VPIDPSKETIAGLTSLFSTTFETTLAGAVLKLPGDLERDDDKCGLWNDSTPSLKPATCACFQLTPRLLQGSQFHAASGEFKKAATAAASAKDDSSGTTTGEARRRRLILGV